MVKVELRQIPDDQNSQLQRNNAETATDHREIRVIQPSGQAGETQAGTQPTIPLVPSQPLDDVRIPRWATGQSEGRRPEAKKKTQKAGVKKVKHKEPKVQEADADQRADSKRTENDIKRAAPEYSDVRQKVVTRGEKRRDYFSREVVSDDDDDTDREAISEHSEVRRDYRRARAEGHVRGRVIEQREPERGVVVERERRPRAIEDEEPHRGLGLFDLFER